MLKNKGNMSSEFDDEKGGVENNAVEESDVEKPENINDGGANRVYSK